MEVTEAKAITTGFTTISSSSSLNISCKQQSLMYDPLSMLFLTSLSKSYFIQQEEDLRVPPLPQAQPQPGRTYLVDHHPQLFEPPANYATMPRQPPLTSTFSHSNTLGGRGGANNVPRAGPPGAHQFEEEERRRQAYIQSLGNLPGKTCRNVN